MKRVITALTAALLLTGCSAEELPEPDYHGYLAYLEDEFNEELEAEKFMDLADTMCSDIRELGSSYAQILLADGDDMSDQIVNASARYVCPDVLESDKE